jgi:hypothetical protein
MEWTYNNELEDVYEAMFKDYLNIWVGHVADTTKNKN